eukprot:SAG22_NODE_8999_length_615_cov_1.195736_1_plen_183_part_10
MVWPSTAAPDSDAPLKADDTAAGLSANVLHVSPNASYSSGDGSAARPYSLLRARDALRQMQAAGATVLLHGGDYFLPEPFVLTGADSGAPDQPVTYMSRPGDRARLTAGKLSRPEIWTVVALVSHFWLHGQCRAADSDVRVPTSGAIGRRVSQRRGRQPQPPSAAAWFASGRPRRARRLERLA